METVTDFNDKELNKALLKTAEEYERLIRPYITQVKMDDRFDYILSPIARIAEMNKTLLPQIKGMDEALAESLNGLTAKYQPMLDKLLKAEKNMAMIPSELIKPQIYVPGVTTALITMSNAIKPWLADLNVISNIDTSAIADISKLGSLAKVEKDVAGLSVIRENFTQMTSISAQIASLERSDISEKWKTAIIPPELISNLNDFAIKQYEIIKESTDARDVDWRLGMIAAASKYVDLHVNWSAELAVESNGIALKQDSIIPDFSELPQLLGPAKRDNKDVEEAFDESLLMEVTGMGKLIIQKARAINDFCRAREKSVMFADSDLIEWSTTLAGSYCRDTECLNEVISTLQEMFVREPIIKTIGHASFFDELESYINNNERKKGKITRIQRKIYKQIIKIEDNIIDSFGNIEQAVLNEDNLSTYVFKALLNIQKDKIYEGAKENTINDGIRNNLSMIYEVKDQTRQGRSVNQTDAGEVDIMICDSGKPWALMEGLKLDSLNKNYLDVHLHKALTNYDPIGCPYLYILVYTTVKKFEDFWVKLIDYMKSYKYPYEVHDTFKEENYVYTESRHGRIILKRNGKYVSLHVFAIAVR